MNPALTYLMNEICAGVEIYYTARIGGQYLNTAFILCDDYTELVSKLFLQEDNPQWTDKKANNHFKNYHDVLQDVEEVVTAKLAAQMQRVRDLQVVMKLLVASYGVSKKEIHDHHSINCCNCFFGLPCFLT